MTARTLVVSKPFAVRNAFALSAVWNGSNPWSETTKMLLFGTPFPSVPTALTRDKRLGAVRASGLHSRQRFFFRVSVSSFPLFLFAPLVGAPRNRTRQSRNRVE